MWGWLRRKTEAPVAEGPFGEPMTPEEQARYDRYHSDNSIGR